MRWAPYISLFTLVALPSGAAVSDAAVKHQAAKAKPAKRYTSRGTGLPAPMGTPSARSRTGPGSFVPYKADNVQGLVDQINSDTKVASRYSRHFSTPKETLAQYFTDNLKLVHLAKPRKVRTYFVSKNGRVLSRTCMLPTGTRVFATRDGRAIIEWRCGNPLTRKLPSRGEPIKLTSKAVPEVKVAPFEQEIGVLPPVLTPEVLTLAAVPITMAPTLEPMIETTAAPPVSFPPIISALAPLLLGAVAVRHSEGPPKVPEPSALVVLGAGISSTLALYRVRRRRS